MGDREILLTQHRVSLDATNQLCSLPCSTYAFFMLSQCLFMNTYTEVYTFNINSLFLKLDLWYTGKIPHSVLAVLFSLPAHTHSFGGRARPAYSSWSDIGNHMQAGRTKAFRYYLRDTEATRKSVSLVLLNSRIAVLLFRAHRSSKSECSFWAWNIYKNSGTLQSSEKPLIQ